LVGTYLTKDAVSSKIIETAPSIIVAAKLSPSSFLPSFGGGGGASCSAYYNTTHDAQPKEYYNQFPPFFSPPHSASV
jgi:hypothetical protein